MEKKNPKIKMALIPKFVLTFNFLILLFVQKQTKNVMIDFDAHEIQFRGDVSGFQIKEWAFSLHLLLWNGKNVYNLSYFIDTFGVWYS